MKYFLAILMALSLNVFAHNPEPSEFVDRVNEDGEWKVLVAGPYRYYSPDGKQVFVCLKRFSTDQATTKTGKCLDENGDIAWTNARLIKVDGYRFHKFELKYSHNGYDKQGRTIVRVNLLVHFKKNVYI
jgi:hypothetical protein